MENFQTKLSNPTHIPTHCNAVQTNFTKNSIFLTKQRGIS